MLSIGLLLLLTKADSAESKSLANRKVDLGLRDNLINHTLPDQKGKTNRLRDNANRQADTGRSFQPPRLPLSDYTRKDIPDWVYNEPLLETANEGVESGEIMRALFNETVHLQSQALSTSKTEIDDKKPIEYDQVGRARAKRFSGDLIPEESGTDEFIVKVFSPTFSCSGSILSKRKVLTAAHCTEKGGKTVSLQVAFNGKNYPVKNIRRCPNYPMGENKACMNDIALLSLSSPLPKSALRLKVNLNYKMENEQAYQGRVDYPYSEDNEPSVDSCYELISNNAPPGERFPEFIGIGLGRHGPSCEYSDGVPRKGFYQRSYKYAGHSTPNPQYCQKSINTEKIYTDFYDCMSQYSCYFNGVFNEFTLKNKKGEYYRTCPGDSGSPLLAFNQDSGRYDLIGVLSGGSQYSYLNDHKAWFEKYFSTSRINPLEVYDTGMDRNLKIPVQSGKWPVPNTTLQQDLNITLHNQLSTGPWFWSSQWSKLTLDIHDLIFGLRRTAYCYSWNGNSCSIPLLRGAEKLSMTLGLGPVTQNYGYQFNITRLNERKQNITFTVYENRNLVVSFKVEPDDIFQPYDLWSDYG
ncbi:hypothetical protein GV64_14940 [Endozoicomonas elysicola]|uniref:Peptidase S1 domain-containing protein n=2 Tax=Endozoicomonas elysicola TaxID=305900 RepID=A0A081KCI3_9GAMM|nr:hypothetical protein GV64_14940 [Endozoicomonas elysicola]